MVKKEFFSSLPYILVLVLSLMLVGCQSETIKIGTLLDKTGDLGSYGPPMEVGADLAIQLLQDAGMDIVKYLVIQEQLIKNQ
jgi:ABC-type branched-subunit amino acid transport system substrate-binding protein